jgi:hypothetical protein
LHAGDAQKAAEMLLQVVRYVLDPEHSPTPDGSAVRSDSQGNDLGDLDFEAIAGNKLTIKVYVIFVIAIFCEITHLGLGEKVQEPVQFWRRFQRH